MATHRAVLQPQRQQPKDQRRLHLHQLDNHHHQYLQLCLVFRGRQHLLLDHHP